jgi:hypothetical protein
MPVEPQLGPFPDLLRRVAALEATVAKIAKSCSCKPAKPSTRRVDK